MKETDDEKHSVHSSANPLVNVSCDRSSNAGNRSRRKECYSWRHLVCRQTIPPARRCSNRMLRDSAYRQVALRLSAKLRSHSYAHTPLRRVIRWASPPVNGCRTLCWSKYADPLTKLLNEDLKRTGTSALWRIPASGGNPQRLEVGGDDSIQPSISRQGHRLAYMKWSPDENIYRIVLPDAKNPGISPASFLASTRVDANAQLSPDGKRIGFESDHSGSSREPWACDIDGSNCAPVTSFGTFARMPRWSPDGKRIVCESSREGKTSISMIDLGTHGVRGLVADPSEERAPSWSRDGQWIYFGSKRSGSWQIWKVLAEGGAPVQVTKQGGFLPIESPDARFVYYDKGNVAGVWRVPIDGGEEILILDQLKPGMSGNWAVVDDGIYFIRFDHANTDEEGAILFYDLATGRVKETVKLGKHHIISGGLSVSSDRRSFFYTVWEHPGGDIMLVENFR
jgi:Tol biopolymer transport system component